MNIFFVIKIISLNKYFFILFFLISIVNNFCLDLGSQNNYCQLHIAQNLNQKSYKECLRCYINSHIIKINNQCQIKVQCIEFEFLTEILFEKFFYNYSYVLKDLFQLSNSSPIANALYVNIKHDKIKELNLRYIQSIIKSNGIEYSYLFFTLFDYRENILVDFQTDLFKIPLIGIQIQINCDENIKNIYYINRYDKSQIHSNHCVTIRLNHTKTTSTIKSSTITPKLPINLFIFIGGLIVFLIWIICLCLCLYIRYYKWKNIDDLNQRSSIISSMFSVDSLDSRNDDVLFSKHKKQSSGLYTFNNDF